MSEHAWHLSLPKEMCSDITAGLAHEWLVTNGLGGYASGSILGATTRGYHGLLVAALHPPVERVVLVTKVDEEVAFPGGRVLQLGVNEYQDGTIDPHGHTYLSSFTLEGDIPCFTYQLEKHLQLEKRVWMEYGENTTYIQYALHGSFCQKNQDTPLILTLFPFCLSRDHHSLTQGHPNWHFLVESLGNGCQVRAYAGAPSHRLLMSKAAHFTPKDLWYWHVRHRRDQERGLNSIEDVYQPGTISVPITLGERVTLVLSATETLASEVGSTQHEDYTSQALRRHQRRIKQLMDSADRSTNGLAGRDPVYARLVLAADQFLVERSQPSEDAIIASGAHALSDQYTMIAGYPWFTDWGRDSMISLPGLLLCTGRYSEARSLLKAFVNALHEGLIPNRFPDSEQVPEYNTADATLWMFHALHCYLETTNDWSLLKELFPRLVEVIAWHLKGTAYGIGVDPHDGLLREGAPGLQLTWMDAKIGDWVVTPRRGKPVEINALWYCALAYMEKWAVHLSVDALQYGQLRTQVQENFAKRFWYEEGGYLYDVVDMDGVSGQNDAALRPNQLFAASLTHHLLTKAQTQSMLQHITDQLLTPMGLRTLSPQDPNYHRRFNGDPLQRDSAYHQGTVWPWLIGPYIDVHLHTFHDSAALRPLLTTLVDHLWHAGVGTVSEVAEPETPFAPAGCIAQAWSVAELLRVWLALGEV